MKIISLTIALFTISQLSAQWQITSGPIGPNVGCLASNSTSIFGATNQTASRTDNNGDSWTALVSGISGAINAFAFKNNTVFAGGNQGVFQSSDNGNTWTNSSNGIVGFVNSINIQDDDILAGTTRIYKSTNNGVSWSEFSPSLDGSIRSIVSSNDTIITLTLNGGVHFSFNNGTSWLNKNSGLPPQLYCLFKKENTLFAGSILGIYKSEDWGNTWTLTEINLPTSSIVGMGDYIFAGCTDNGGVYASNNFGLTWNQINSGLSNLNIFSLTSNNQYLFAGTSGNVFRRSLSEIIQVNISLSNNPNNAGILSGGGSFSYGQSVTVNAIPNQGYEFVSWNENDLILSNNASFTFTATSNQNLIANFNNPLKIIDPNLIPFNIYPNPSKGIINIQSDKNSEVRIYSIDGGLKLNAFLIEGLNQFYLNEKGFFILEVNNGKNKYYNKLIID